MLKISMAALLALASCTQAAGPSSDRTRILPGSMKDALLDQCSRATPSKGEGTWQPNEIQVAELEKALPAALRAEQPNEDWSDVPSGYLRHYVGIVRGGRRFIYGSFAPYDPLLAGPDVHMVCDGGPAFFGAEYDVERAVFKHLAFNGSA